MLGNFGRSKTKAFVSATYAEGDRGDEADLYGSQCKPIGYTPAPDEMAYPASAELREEEKEIYFAKENGKDVLLSGA